MSLETSIVILGVLLFFSGVFSGIETALMSLNMVKVKALLKQKKKGAETLERIKQNPHKLIITILIGNNLVNIGAASLATVVFTDLFGSKGVGIATGLMTFLILLFGEITPKTLATQHSESISLFVARPIELLSNVLSPLVYLFEIISRGVSKAFGGPNAETVSEEELRTIVTMGAREGLLDRETAKMMHNVLEFEKTQTKEIMTPFNEMQMVDGNANLGDSLNFFLKSPYTKFPVYSGSKEEIIGVLDTDYVLRYVKNNKLKTRIKTISKKVHFVPETKEIDTLLTEFEGKRIPLAIVVDEYGHVSGLVTVEDILEEIVGDIFDKSKKKKELQIKRISSTTLKVKGDTSVDKLNKLLNLGIEKKGFETIAGYLIQRFQGLPKRGTTLKVKNAIIQIEEVTEKQIKFIKIIRK